MDGLWLIMRVRKPRPKLDEIIRQPGTIGVVVTLVLSLALRFLPLPYGTWRVPAFIGTVLGAWAIAWGVGWLRPEQGWIDASGRLITLLWCLSALCALMLRP